MDVHFIEHRALHKEGQLKEREIDAQYVSTNHLILHLFANALIERERVRPLIVIDGQLSTRNDDGLRQCATARLKPNLDANVKEIDARLAALPPCVRYWSRCGKSESRLASWRQRSRQTARARFLEDSSSSGHDVCSIKLANRSSHLPITDEEQAERSIFGGCVGELCKSTEACTPSVPVISSLFLQFMIDY